MIDLKSTYQKVSELLALYGLDGCNYHVSVEAWNLRTSDAQARVVFHIAVQLNPHETFGAYSKPTLDVALDELTRMLVSRGKVTPQQTIGGSLAVELP